ncbi:hypothetical protein Verru16b_00905 [Lacunisphaera limnophila]|uniref:DUF885 domain-containing protein n=1 Tax=Lacunisphaera limnophila TaxID=1838286 RepID=A0A1D8ASG7_9BACT|nr:hypothetical protein Verru16b_00905 [Lacunisphaera limnophila]
MLIPRPRLLLAALFPVLVFASDPAFDSWVDQLTTASMRADPSGATRTQFFTGAEQDALDRQLTPITPAYRAEQLAFARDALAELARFDRAKLDPQQVASARVIEWDLQERVKAAPFEDHRFVFNQFWGLHVTLVNFLSQTHPVRHRRDIENYLARLTLVAGQIDEGVAQAREAATRGFLMPDFITRSALGQFDRFLDAEPAQNVLVTSLAERAAKLADLPADDRTALVAAATQTVREQIIPAFSRARALLQEQLPLTTADAGLWRLPGGEAAYAVRLGYFTTTSLTAREIHETGRREVARIEARMDGLLRELGYKEGSVRERFARLNQDLQPPPRPTRARPSSPATRRSSMIPSAAPKPCSTCNPRPPVSCNASPPSPRKPRRPTTPPRRRMVRAREPFGPRCPDRYSRS